MLLAVGVGERGRGLEFVLVGVDQRRPFLGRVVVVDGNRLGAHLDVMLAHAEEAPDREHVADELAVIDDEILDLADIVLGAVDGVEADQVAAEQGVLRRLAELHLGGRLGRLCRRRDGKSRDGQSGDGEDDDRLMTHGLSPYARRKSVCCRSTSLDVTPTGHLVIGLALRPFGVFADWCAGTSRHGAK